MGRQFFTKIGRQVFFGSLLVYLLVLLTGGVERIIRRGLIESSEILEAGLDRLDSSLGEIRHLTARLEEQDHATRHPDDEQRARGIEALEAQLRAAYDAAARAQPSGSPVRTLLETARHHSDEWIGAMRARSRDRSPAATALATRVSAADAHLVALKQAHLRLMDHIQLRRDQLRRERRELSRKADRFLLAMLVVTLLIIGGITVGVPYLLGRRIQRLLAATRALAAGHYRPGTIDYPEDEFGELARAFDRMAEALQQKEHCLRESLAAQEQMNNTLEALVEKRTEELRAAQEELLRQEKLVVLGTLAGAIGHELRHPLSVMATSVYVLKQIAPTSEAVARHLAILTHQIARAHRTITNLLDFARAREPLWEATDLRELIQEALHSAVLPPTVRLTLSLGEKPALVKADAMQVTHVLSNLIANAVQAMPRGGDLSIALARNGRGFEVIIQDTGSGMSEEQKARLFQPLFTTKPKGIGLGLAVSKKLVDAHKGRITCESKLGWGTRFHLWLPALTPEDVSITSDETLPSTEAVRRRNENAQELLVAG